MVSDSLKERPIYKFIIWLANHPVIFASIVVLMTSLVGYVYENALFAEFDINIFRFSSVYDFMYQWWRQWVVVTHFIIILLMMSGMILGYFFSAFIIDLVGKYRHSVGKITLKEKFSKKISLSLASKIFIFVLAIILLVSISFLLVNINTDVIKSQYLFVAVCYATLYGVISFYSLWIIQHFVISDCCMPVWRLTGVSLLMIGILYLFIIMLININQLAITEARLIKGDTKYTYTVTRSTGGGDSLVSKDAKILAITTYYHLFYVRETGKIVAISNEYIGSIESNWVR